ncbi:MAG: hypothetical protein PUF10_02725 [Bacteroidales bacterium]|nr:hypothetical protein [Bacteroidales bacterium]
MNKIKITQKEVLASIPENIAEFVRFASSKIDFFPLPKYLLDINDDRFEEGIPDIDTYKWYCLEALHHLWTEESKEEFERAFYRIFPLYISPEQFQIFIECLTEFVVVLKRILKEMGYEY